MPFDTISHWRYLVLSGATPPCQPAKEFRSCGMTVQYGIIVYIGISGSCIKSRVTNMLEFLAGFEQMA